MFEAETGMKVWRGGQLSEELLEAHPAFFVQHQLIEYRQHLLAVLIDAPQRIAEPHFVAARLEPFLQQRLRHVDVAAQRVGRMPAQEQPIKHGGLALRGERIEIFPWRHVKYSSTKKPV